MGEPELRQAPAPAQGHGDAEDEYRVPAWVERLRQQVEGTWVGRMAFDMTLAMRRVEIFDRSMTVAAQFFTSVFPLLIIVGLWFDRDASDQIADSIDMPAGTQVVLDDALAAGSSAATFGIFGVLFVLVSGTSLSRALTRAFAKVWDLPRPKVRIVYAWRWLAVLTSLALFLVMSPVLRNLTDDIPPQTGFWPMVALFMATLGIALFVPWILLEARIPLLQLMPGAMLFAIAMSAARPAIDAFLPRALQTSAENYGTIGVAFTYISYLYAVSWAFLGTATAGAVLVMDRGRFGRWVRQEDKKVPAETAA